jgi:hypothetical protein
MCGGHAGRRVHEAEAGLEVQREESAERVGLRKVSGCPVLAEPSIASTCDAGDVAQSNWIDAAPANRPASSRLLGPP